MSEFDIIDMENIADAIGLPTKKKGKHLYCECPSHRKVLGRDDNNISNCILTDYGYKCFACGTKGDIFQMVMDYCDVPFSRAAQIVYGITGKAPRNSDDSVAKTQPFDSNDLELIGITSIANPEGDAGREIIGVSKCRPESNVFFRRGNEYVLYSSVKRITLTQLFVEEEKLYYELIQKNAEVALEKYKNLYSCFNDRGGALFKKVHDLLSVDGEFNSSLAAELKNIFLLNIKRVEKILEECRKNL